MNGILGGAARIVDDEEWPVIAICTDSSGGLGEGDGGLRVLPLTIVLGDDTAADLPGEIQPRLARHLLDGGEAKTSMVSEGQFSRVFAELAETAEAIVSIHLSSAMSGTVASARRAAASASVPVHVVDSGIAGAALGATVRHAQDLAARGATAEEIASAAQDFAQATTTTFLPATLEYLRRGGRIGRASHLLGQALRVHPLLGISEGEVATAAKVRTRTRALERLIARSAEAAVALPEARGAIMHLDSPEEASELAARIAEGARASGRTLDCEVVRLSAGVAAHVGPGVLGTAIWPAG